MLAGACFSSVAAVAVCLHCGAGNAEEGRVKWAVSGGWLVAESEGMLLLSESPGRPVELTVNDKALLATADAAPVTVALPGGGFENTYATEQGTVVERYTPFPALGQDAWLRSLVYTNRSGDVQDLTGVRMRLAPAATPDGATWQPRDFWMA